MEMRTDRSNNPIASKAYSPTMNILKTAGLQEGVHFQAGDSTAGIDTDATPTVKFSTPNLGYVGARAVLENGQMGSWYANPKYGGANRILAKLSEMTGRQENTATSTEAFKNLGIAQKNQIIKDIYKHEGGSGKLVPVTDDYDKKIDKARQLGYTDTEILDKVSDPELQAKIKKARTLFGTSGINNDRDLLNYLSNKLTGKTPTVPSVSKDINQGETSPQGSQSQKSILRKVGDFFTGAEQAFGKTLGTAISTFDPETQKLRDETMASQERQYQNYIKLAQEETDPNKKKNYLEAAKRSAESAGVDIYNNPEYQKTAKQILGEAGGVGLDILTAGSYGGVGAEAKSLAGGGKMADIIGNSGKLVKAMPEIGSMASGALKAGELGAKATPSLARLAGRAALEGGALGAGYGVTGAMQNNESGADILKSGVIGGATGGLLGGGISAGLSKLGGAPGKATNKLAQNLNNIFEESTIPIRGAANFVSEKGNDLGSMIVENGIKPVIKNERLMFGKNEIAKVNSLVEKDTKIRNEAINEYSKRFPGMTAEELKQKSANVIKSNPIAEKQGIVQDLIDKSNKKIDDYVKQWKTNTFTLNQIESMKEGAYSLSKRYKKELNYGDSDAYSGLGSAFMKVIEDEIPDVNIKAINKRLGENLSLQSFLQTVDKKGGIVLQGGKLGKYFSNTGAQIVGGVLGTSAGGPIVGGLSAMAASVASNVIRDLSHKISLLGPIDRLFIKLAKKMPENADILLAKEFLDKVKSGENITPSPRVQQIIQDMIFPKEQLMLRGGKPGTSSNNVPINLQQLAQSTKDKKEIEAIQKQILGKKFKEVAKPKETQKMIPQTATPSKPPVTNLPQQTTSALEKKNIWRAK